MIYFVAFVLLNSITDLTIKDTRVTSMTRIVSECTHENVCAIAPARPPHTSLAGSISATPPAFCGFPSNSGNVSRAKFFNISKLLKERPENKKAQPKSHGELHLHFENIVYNI